MAYEPIDVHPTKERIKEIKKILKDPKNKVRRRLKRDGLHEHYPVRFLAASIARAEKRYVEVYQKIRSEKVEAESRKKKAKLKMKRQIKTLEKKIGKSFDDLPHDIQMSGFYKKGKEITVNLDSGKGKNEAATENPDYVRDSSVYKSGPVAKLEEKTAKQHSGNINIREYGAASRDMNYATDRLSRLFKAKTKPKEKAVNVFCQDMKILFAKRGLDPNYSLIADLINLFNLSKKPQTPDSIRKRFSRNQQL